MGCGKVFLLTFSVLTALFLYRLYQPLPENIEERWKVQMYMGVSNLIADLSKLGSMLGYGHEAVVYRNILDIAVSAADDKDRTGLTVTDTEFDGVSVRIYTPKTAAKSGPGIVYYHGGGWYFGSIELYEGMTKRLALGSNAVVVSVGYRLAPEHPYPIPLEDCVKATTYFIKNAEKFGVNQKRVAVSGDSAGGNLAAAVSLKIRGMTGFPQPKVQLMIYPMLQVFDLNLPSYQQYTHELITSRALIARCAALYSGLGLDYVDDIMINNHTSQKLKKEFRSVINPSDIPAEFREGYFQEKPNYGSQVISDKIEAFLIDPFVAPLMGNNFKGLPEAFILTVDNDVLRDDGILYAKKLEKAGVKVTWKHIPNIFHGVLNSLEGPLQLESGLKVVRVVSDFLKEKL